MMQLAHACPAMTLNGSHNVPLETSSGVLSPSCAAEYSDNGIRYLSFRLSAGTFSRIAQNVIRLEKSPARRILDNIGSFSPNHNLTNIRNGNASIQFLFSERQYMADSRFCTMILFNDWNHDVDNSQSFEVSRQDCFPGLALLAYLSLSQITLGPESTDTFIDQLIAGSPSSTVDLAQSEVPAPLMHTFARILGGVHISDSGLLNTTPVFAYQSDLFLNRYSSVKSFRGELLGQLEELIRNANGWPVAARISKTEGAEPYLVPVTMLFLANGLSDERQLLLAESGETPGLNFVDVFFPDYRVSYRKSLMLSLSNQLYFALNDEKSLPDITSVSQLAASMYVDLIKEETTNYSGAIAQFSAPPGRQ
jgi:hypothetical protein